MFRKHNNSTDQVSWMIIQDVKLKLAAQDIRVDDNSQTKSFFLSMEYALSVPTNSGAEMYLLRSGGDTVMITSGSLGEDLGGYGAKIRGNPGVCVFVVVWYSNDNYVLGHELRGVEVGMMADNYMGFSRVHFGMDSMTDVVLLNNSGRTPHWNVQYVYLETHC